MACEDANSKLVEVVTVANVDAEKRVRCRFGSRSLVIRLNFVQTLSTRLSQDFEVEVQARF